MGQAYPRRGFLWAAASVLALAHRMSGQGALPLQKRRFQTAQIDTEGKTVSRTEAECSYFVEELGSGVLLEMTYVPGGTFHMGSGERIEERPVHTVSVPDFFLGTYEVTRGQWRRVAALPRVRHNLTELYRLKQLPEDVENRLPVDNIQVREMEEFCDRLQKLTGKTYRLPSEAEWEYACRAGASSEYSFGDGISLESANVNLLQRPLALSPVESNGANGFGIYGMHGNVLEMTQDRAHENYVGAPEDGSAWVSRGNASQRVARGGMFLWKAERARSVARSFWHTSAAASGVGFRVALSTPAKL
jgi:formylglycine-generating enzyme required for sulfatase activity